MANCGVGCGARDVCRADWVDCEAVGAAVWSRTGAVIERSTTSSGPVALGRAAVGLAAPDLVEEWSAGRKPGNEPPIWWLEGGDLHAQNSATVGRAGR